MLGPTPLARAAHGRNKASISFSDYLRDMGSGLSRWPGARVVIVEGDRGLAVYLVDAARELWRVYDCASGPPTVRPGQRAVFAPPNLLATERWFVAQDGNRRCYHFRARDRRELEPRLLVGQLTAARPAERA